MHAYSTNIDISPQLTTHKLTATALEMINQAAIWSEEKWGYVLKFAGLENRKKLITELTFSPHGFYFLTYGKQPAGMFSLRSCADREICPELSHLKNMLELDYVYTAKGFRGLGIGNKIVERAKIEARHLGAKHLEFDTLDPVLNNFYLKHGAKIICKSNYHGFPTDKLLIAL